MPMAIGVLTGQASPCRWGRPGTWCPTASHQGRSILPGAHRTGGGARFPPRAEAQSPPWPDAAGCWFPYRERHGDCDRRQEPAHGVRRPEVVHGIDLTVGSGEVFAVLGPNGAGKTTTIEILEGFRRRSGGDVASSASTPSEPSSWRERIGVVLQPSSPEAELTVVETLRLYAGFYATPAPVDHLPRAVRAAGPGIHAQQAALRRPTAPARCRARARRESRAPVPRRADHRLRPGGAARRLAHRSKGSRRSGTTIVLTTHYLEEAEILADRIAIVVEGHVVAEGTPTELGGRDPGGNDDHVPACRGHARSRRRGESRRPVPVGDRGPDPCAPRDLRLGDRPRPRARGRRSAAAEPRRRLPPAHEGARDSMTVSIDHDHAGRATAVETARNGRKCARRGRCSPWCSTRPTTKASEWCGTGPRRASPSACRSRSWCSSSPSSATAPCTSTATP